MEQRIELSGFQRPKSKSLREALGASLVSLVILASAPLAQGDQPSKESRALAKDLRNLPGQTIDAFGQENKVKQRDELQELARQVLENRPLEPLNREKFVPQIYPETSPLVPAPGPAPTEEEVAAMLRDYLQKDWPNNPLIQRAGLLLFSHPLVKEKIPNPSLRAALVGLGRTIGVDAIAFILLAKTPEGLPKVKEIKFDDQNLLPERAAAASVIDNVTGQLTFIFNPKYQA